MNTKLSGKRIFIVEDNTMNRVVYTMALKLSNAVIDFDIFGLETVNRLRIFQPDLIILDLMLSSTTSGFDVFENIRAQPEYNNVPIVAISSSEPSVALPKCQKMGFSGFIAKPIDEALLPEQVSQLIEGEQVWYFGERYGG